MLQAAARYVTARRRAPWGPSSERLALLGCALLGRPLLRGRLLLRSALARRRGGNIDGRACPRVATLARLPLCHGERTKLWPRHLVARPHSAAQHLPEGIEHALGIRLRHASLFGDVV